MACDSNGICLLLHAMAGRCCLIRYVVVFFRSCIGNDPLLRFCKGKFVTRVNGDGHASCQHFRLMVAVSINGSRSCSVRNCVRTGRWFANYVHRSSACDGFFLGLDLHLWFKGGGVVVFCFVVRLLPFRGGYGGFFREFIFSVRHSALVRVSIVCVGRGELPNLFSCNFGHFLGHCVL